MSDHEQAAAQGEQNDEVMINDQPSEAATSSLEAAAEIQEQEAVQEADRAEEADASPEVLSTQLAEAEKQRDEYLDQWRRSAAEFQNYRKREERLRSERERSANARLLKKLLPIMDDLQRAAKHVPEEIAANDWVEGMMAIERKLWNVLEQEGVKTIEADQGIEFNPNVHEALISQPSEEIESGHIIDEFEKGYLHHDSVLRPARVSVAQ